MNNPTNLDTLFTKKLFRIPDYQRGYAWQKEQLQAFWEDLVNLQENRSHYTGMLTLRQIPKQDVRNDSEEFWLVDGQSYQLYDVVDGQQRLTTTVILIQAFADFYLDLPENKGKSPTEIFVTDNKQLSQLIESYLYKKNPRGGFRTYKFCYSDENPSNEFLRHRVFGEVGAGEIEETFYTLNIGIARKFFNEQIRSFYKSFGGQGLANLFDKLTNRLLFNEYVISNDFDVFVAFETMNNRGKKLSDLELLKNRLIYLTTLFPDSQIDNAGKQNIRKHINNAWKEAYQQLGSNKTDPLNDDDFLRALWIVCFQYSRDSGRDYANFLLEKHFHPRNIQETRAFEVELDEVHERRVDDLVEIDEDPRSIEPAPSNQSKKKITPDDVLSFVLSLNESAGHWFASFYPEMVNNLSGEIKVAVERLNRIGMGYFRPLVMVTLKKNLPEIDKIQLFARIERFILIAFRMGTFRSNYRSSEFYKAARDLNLGTLSLQDLHLQLDQALGNTFEDGYLNANTFIEILRNKFKEGTGYYGWSGLRFVLYEYEQSLLEGSRQKKVAWTDLLKSGKDKISIEHIYPQTSTPDWEPAFASIPQEMRSYYNGSIGNLLLLSMSINASLQNDSFESKKKPHFDSLGKKIRNGYADGSHSEIEVASNPIWGPEQIRNRGTKLLKFMEERWKFKLRDADRERLLFLDPI